MAATVVVGSVTVVDPKDAPHEIVSAVVPVKRNSTSCPSTGVPVRFVLIDDIAVASPVKFAISVVPTFVLGLAPGAFTVTKRRTTALFVKVSVVALYTTVSVTA